ncbi:hypothetical protein CC1G_14494 [Coprinopsis cinerea okayama7|uniref:Uncharacterized protein n=1 Tax=Coprinopsis cinerea (strain Okayama-7 / 130 / ATCC MYA-4618 / FGSC 9003) TaxID=240176 RepID=D6RLV4_COPC7|nr:hypothetical protein CC1G_14494 [Coprinopsis cinerea okayama7\|eukprot:XP_002911496.1 hypothetical protein CC1G_14494 [Coprinopsis cinerea okayama7\
MSAFLLCPQTLGILEDFGTVPGSSTNATGVVNPAAVNPNAHANAASVNMNMGMSPNANVNLNANANMNANVANANQSSGFRSSSSPVMRGGDGGVSDGGSSDGGHSGHSVGVGGAGQQRAGAGSGYVAGGRGRRRLLNDLAGTTGGDPYTFQYGQRRARAGSTASTSSTRPSTQHGFDSVNPSPLITAQTLASNTSQPGSATNTTFSNAFNSLSLDDQQALASLVGSDGRNLGLFPHLTGASGGSESSDPDATPLAMPSQQQRASQTGAGPGFSPIQRPVSSLAALPPSSYLNSVWQQGAQGAGANDTDTFGWGAHPGSGSVFGTGTGWTPGGLLADFNFGSGDNSNSNASSNPDGSSGDQNSGSNPGAGGGGGGSLGLPSVGGGGLGLFPGFGPTGLTPTPGKEVDANQMKEFWKMYMKTPLTGPGFDAGAQHQVGGGGNSEGDGNPGHSSSNSGDHNSSGNHNNSSSNPAPGTPGYRRPRVASLPSSNSTPKLHRDGAVAHLQHLQQQLHQQGKLGALGPMSSLRTTLHGPLGGDGPPGQNNQGNMPGHQEDLASYGAAVLARKAPVNLSLARALERMKRHQQQGGGAHSNRPSNLSYGGSTTASSGSPSLSSRESSVGVDGQQQQQRVDGGGGDVRMGSAEAEGERVVRPRPSVKRLASSVLENEVVKVGRFDGKDGDATTAAGDVTMSSPSRGGSPLVAPIPSAPFALPPASDDGDAMQKAASTSSAKFPPPGSLAGDSAQISPPSSSSAPPMGLAASTGLPFPGGRSSTGSGGMSLLERRARGGMGGGPVPVALADAATQ